MESPERRFRVQTNDASSYVLAKHFKGWFVRQFMGKREARQCYMVFPHAIGLQAASYSSTRRKIMNSALLGLVGDPYPLHVSIGDDAVDAFDVSRVCHQGWGVYRGQ